MFINKTNRQAFFESILSSLLLLILGQTYCFAQGWKMPADSERCPSAWGAGDQRGSANMMNPSSILKAIRLVKTGEMFELGEVLTNNPDVSYINRGRQFSIYTKPTIPKAGTRAASEELVITELGQIGTQIDGFAHQMHGDSFYNCFKFEDIASRTGYSKLGIENVGTLISRGVLIDIAALKEVEMVDQDYMISASDLQQALTKQAVTLQPGDAVIINTGWGKNRGQNNSIYGTNTPGIGAEAGVWLVEQQPILVGADTCCVEFRSEENRRLDVHSMMLIEHGIYMIENMELQALSSAKAYEFLFIVQPLKLKGATGSAVAPIAIR
jgi:kynurenine formamidase